MIYAQSRRVYFEAHPITRSSAQPSSVTFFASLAKSCLIQYSTINLLHRVACLLAVACVFLIDRRNFARKAKILSFQSASHGRHMNRTTEHSSSLPTGQIAYPQHPKQRIVCPSPCPVYAHVPIARGDLGHTPYSKTRTRGQWRPPRAVAVAR